MRGESLRTVAERSATSPWSIMRHRKHMGAALMTSQANREKELGSDLLVRLADLEANAHRALARAERIASEEGQAPKVVLEATKTALLALREHARQIELVGKLRGELRSDVTVNVEANVGVQVVQSMSLDERELRAKNAVEALRRQRERDQQGLVVA